VNSNKAARSQRAGRVRIIAGEFRGRRIPVPARPNLRPTPDRVRETLFNWLGQWLSGALGFEAASRGAERVVMVDNDRAAFSALEKARAEIGAKQVEVIFGDALAYLHKTPDRFDVVFLDPPFRQNALASVLEELPARLVPGARVYIEAAAPLEPGPEWRELKTARAGQVSYQLLEWRGHDQGGIPGNV
jgi:16S rRNA (guanine966-N2)-methyltransferase